MTDQSLAPFIRVHRSIRIRCTYSAERDAWLGYFDLPPRPAGPQAAILTHLARAPGLHCVSAASGEAVVAAAIDEIDDHMSSR